MDWTSIPLSENSMTTPETSCFGGSGSTSIQYEFTSKKGSSYQMYRPWEGVFGRLERTFTETTSERTRTRLLSYMTDEPCLSCNGAKLNPAVRGVFVGGTNLPHFNGSSILEALAITQIWTTGELDTSFWKEICLLYTSPSPRDATLSRMPSSA